MRVLIVDDDDNVRAAARNMLKAAGTEVAEATNGVEAIRLLRGQGADVVLCDLYMPNRDGFEVIRELRRDFPDVKVVAMSGGGFTDTADMLSAARHLGATAILNKPFKQADALAALERALK
jgi:CheY-like chemotaxis protein